MANLSVIVGWVHRTMDRQDLDGSRDIVQWHNRHLHIRASRCASIDFDSRFASPPCTATVVAVNITRTTISDFDKIDNVSSETEQNTKWEGRESIEMSALGNDKKADGDVAFTA